MVSALPMTGSRSKSGAGVRVGAYHHERVAAPVRRGAERPPLASLKLAQSSGGAPKDRGGQFRGHYAGEGAGARRRGGSRGRLVPR
jgi:hypothetical protein